MGSPGLGRKSNIGKYVWFVCNQCICNLYCLLYFVGYWDAQGKAVVSEWRTLCGFNSYGMNVYDTSCFLVCIFTFPVFCLELECWNWTTWVFSHFSFENCCFYVWIMGPRQGFLEHCLNFRQMREKVLFMWKNG